MVKSSFGDKPKVQIFFYVLYERISVLNIVRI